MPTTSEVNQAADNFIADTEVANLKINGSAGQVTDRHGVTTPNLAKILEDVSGAATDLGDISVAVSTAQEAAARAIEANAVYEDRAAVNGATPSTGVEKLSYYVGGRLVSAVRSDTGFLTTADGGTWALEGGVAYYASLEELAASSEVYGNGTAHITMREGFSYVEDDGAPDLVYGGLGLVVQPQGDVLNAKAFGAVGDGVADDTLAVQKAIDAASGMSSAFVSSGGPTVYLPSGQYLVSLVIRRSGVKIMGDGSRNTLLMAKARGTPSGQDPEFGLLEIEDGPVSAAWLEGVCVCGSSTPTGTTPVNASQWGIYTKAKFGADTSLGGGLWYGGYKDVWVRGFKYGEWSRAGYTNQHYLKPNQFIEYDSFVCQVTAGGEARRFTGQHGQITHTSGDSGALDSLMAARAITIDWDPDPSQVATTGVHGESTTDTAGSGNAVLCPENVNFGSACGIQRANLGVFVRNALNVSFDGCWFESLGGAFEVVTNGAAFVTNSRFANAADGARGASGVAGEGFLVKLGNNAGFEAGTGNFITGVHDNWVEPSVDLANVKFLRLHNLGRDSTGKINTNLPPTATVESDGSIDIKGHDHVYVRGNQGDRSILLTSISAMHTPRDMITIRVWDGNLHLGNTGNLRIGRTTATALTAPEGSYVTLQRVNRYSGIEWVVTSVEDAFLDAVPTSDYWYRGTKIWRVSQTPGVSMGWVCTTSGTAGVDAVFSPMPPLS